MSFDFIVDHALKNVWGSPPQDSQFILTLPRITSNNGVKGTVQVLWDSYSLPDANNRYFVYQIGGINPLAAFNLFVHQYKWVSLAQACNQQTLIAKLYTDSGVEYPLHQAYYRFTESGNVLVAVLKDSRIPVAQSTEKVHLRVYSNAFFQSVRSNGLTEDLVVTSKTLESAADIAAMFALYNGQSALPGHVFVTVNGVQWSIISPGSLSVGQAVTLVYDASVYKKLRYRIGTLDDFESTMDLKRKYLIHYPGTTERIDFQDDIDVFVTMKLDNDNYRGVYYHKNNEDALRNVTHKDYSVPTTYVKRHTEAVVKLVGNSAPMDANDLYIEFYIRNAGWDRPLVMEANRIHELYSLAEEDVYKAMVGIDATVPNWTPAALEASMYPFVMRSDCDKITNSAVEQAYGYNTISKLTADTPVKVTGASVDVPYRLQFGATAYEYNEEGNLVGWFHHYVGQQYVPRSVDCVLVEFVAGFGGNILDEQYDLREGFLKSNHSYRVYVSRAVAGVSDNKWVDVTDDDEYYTVQNNHYQWVSASATAYPMVRSDSRFLAVDMELSMENGALNFSLKHLQNRDDTIQTWLMQIPLGQMDVWINGKSAIRGLDYFGTFPDFHIVSKNHLRHPLTEVQRIHVRFMGHCTPSMEMLPEGDIGFVEHGVLSNNSRYDLRDDKVLRIVVGGAVATRDDFIFSEKHSGVNTLSPLNGTPYMVKDLYVPVKQFTTQSTYPLWEEAKKVDQVVSDYLSKKLPQPVRPAPSAVAYRYQLFSPFCNKLILDLKYGRLSIPQKPTGYTRQDVIALCASYEYLLKFDPVQGENTQDDRYVVIHPHSLSVVLSLPKNEYQFMLQVVKYYTNDLVSLSNSVVIAV